MRYPFSFFVIVAFSVAAFGQALAQSDKTTKVLAVAKHEDGIICDYLASESKATPDVVSVRMDKRDFNFINGLQTETQYDQLSQLPIGSRIKFDFSVLDAYGDPVDKSVPSPKPNVVIDKIHSIGEADASLCRSLAE
ncbi:MAG: hypothetical protein LBJ61_06105 [Deltaproteobacteria bacterium]|jgi:hypothetical protein|nr:hypothetical protein [Deltaproteobacteria bacterium]